MLFLVQKEYSYIFSENGLVGYFGEDSLESGSILEHLGEEKLQDLINFSLEYLSKIKLPCKRGNFIEFRRGMLNISPIGRSCTQEERLAFVEYEKDHPVRAPFVTALEERFKDYGLKFAIGKIFRDRRFDKVITF